MTEHTHRFHDALLQVTAEFPHQQIDQIAEELATLRDHAGRLFILGVGGGAGHASHAVNDFRKLCNIEAYAPTDNVSELTARINDDGWDSAYAEWLRVSNISKRDALLIFSVGGGDLDRNVSVNLVECINLAVSESARVFGVVGKQSGYTTAYADVAIVMPLPEDTDLLTPLTESYQAIIWHCLVSHPKLQRVSTKW